MMVYGLDHDTSNTDKLFNLVCLYGNVARVSWSIQIVFKLGDHRDKQRFHSAKSEIRENSFTELGEYEIKF